MKWREWMAGGLVLRLVLLAYGLWQDQHSPALPYTDVDYTVFTDAARFVYRGQSPYQRATYRYTPLLAWLLLPNVVVWRAVWGKLLFVGADLLVAQLLLSLMITPSTPSTPNNSSTLIGLLWLCNPLVMAISTRGNAESLLCALTLLTAYWLVVTPRRLFRAAVVFGCAVHLKIYPIVYALPILVSLRSPTIEGVPVEEVEEDSVAVLGEGTRKRRNSLRRNAKTSAKTSAKTHSLRRLLNRDRVQFTVVSACTFLLLTAAMYGIYGEEFLRESYWYHLSRKDHRHNFSLYFYPIYLTYKDVVRSRYLSLLAFVPQLLVVAWVGLVYARDLVFAWFLQTLLFVTFNKVCTSQYFMWYLCYLPLVLHRSHLLRKPRLCGGLLLAWFGAQGLWLSQAYRLEMLGEPTYLWIWMASVVFFGVNIGIACVFIRERIPQGQEQGAAVEQRRRKKQH